MTNTLKRIENLKPSENMINEFVIKNRIKI